MLFLELFVPRCLELHVSNIVIPFQVWAKAIIMFNLMLPLVEVMNIMKINQYQIHYKMYGYRAWFNDILRHVL
jgi:hypothetical protein